MIPSIKSKQNIFYYVDLKKKITGNVNKTIIIRLKLYKPIEFKI